MPNYEIVLRGEAGPTVRSAFAELHVNVGGGQTVLTGEIADQAALHGLLNRARNLGLDILNLHQVDELRTQRS